MTQRATLLARLQEETFDLLVIGGGITGAGIVRDAALRGLRVALVEKSDLATGTSSASSKLIHGGLRYLEQLELSLVREGVRERGLLMKNAPHLARPLPFLFPVYEDARVGMLQLRAGMWLYDMLSGFSSYRMHRMFPRRKASQAEPELEAKGLRGAAIYYDCLTNDARLTLETALDAEDHGALVATWLEAAELSADAAGKTVGAMVRDRLSGDGLTGGAGGQPFPIKARVTAIAAGPWTDKLLKPKLGRDLLRPTKGSHLVLDRARLPLNHAVVLTHPEDGRVMFAIPWGARTVIGTTDTDEGEQPDGLEASRYDVDYMLTVANRYFPRLKGTTDDVIATWAGLRPLMGASDDLDPSEVSREHAILNVDPGLVAIAGGKLTTYRLMSEQLVDRVVKKLGYKVKLEPCRTKDTPLRGATQDPKALEDVEARARELAREQALDDDVARHLIESYGQKAREVLAAGQEARTRPGRLVKGLPYLVDEVAYAVRHEKAERLDDVLRRRTLVFLQDPEQGLGVCEEAARIMADHLRWPQDRVDLEVARYRQLVEGSRAWQRQPAYTRTPSPPVTA